MPTDTTGGYRPTGSGESPPSSMPDMKSSVQPPVNMRWRVDVADVPVSVYGEDAMRHLERVNHQLARMKLALNKLRWHENSQVSRVAEMGLKND